MTGICYNSLLWMCTLKKTKKQPTTRKSNTTHWWGLIPKQLYISRHWTCGLITNWVSFYISYSITGFEGRMQPFYLMMHSTYFVVEYLLNVQWVIGSIPHDGAIELCLIAASVMWYVLSCLWEGAYKIIFAANQKE